MCRTTTQEDLAGFIPYYNVTRIGRLCDIVEHIRERCEDPELCSLYIEHQTRCEENNRMDEINEEVTKRADWVRQADKAIFKAVYSATSHPPVLPETYSELQDAMSRSDVLFEGYLMAQTECRALVKDMLLRRAGWEATEKIIAFKSR
ncbi:hypothetical protein MMC18_004735 [Xylographa bjoerkii]|nr:hypothetical protein [Xylographa bjoerkii]